MGLGQKLRKLSLAGLASLPLIGSSCEALILGGAHIIASENQREGMIEAAKIKESSKNMEEKNDLKHILPKPRPMFHSFSYGELPEEELFTARGFKGDLNNDNLYQKSEYIDPNAVNFRINQPIYLATNLIMRKGSKRRLEIYKIIDGKKIRALNSSITTISKDILSSYYPFHPGLLDEGFYIAELTVEGENIGKITFTINN